MAVLAGYGGSVTFATGYAVKIDTWEITYTATELDTTGFEDAEAGGGESWRTFIGGVKEWRGTFSGKLDAASTTPETGLGGAAASAVFHWGAATLATAQVSGTIVATEAAQQTSIGSANTCNFTFVGSGKPTLTAG